MEKLIDTITGIEFFIERGSSFIDVFNCHGKMLCQAETEEIARSFCMEYAQGMI